MIRQPDAAGRLDRALGAFYGLALGDTLGMPTQDLSRDRIAADYGTIVGFRVAGPHQLIAAGMPAGTVTDDTEQAVLLARLLIDGHGRLDPRTVADALIDWEARARSRGSVAARLWWATGQLAGLTPAAQAEAVDQLIGTSVAAQESVVAAIALAAVAEDPWETLGIAAGVGGDTDTIAAICGAVLGSVFGLASWPAEDVATVTAVNRLELEPVVDGLLALRDAEASARAGGRAGARS